MTYFCPCLCLCKLSLCFVIADESLSRLKVMACFLRVFVVSKHNDGAVLATSGHWSALSRHAQHMRLSWSAPSNKPYFLQPGW